MNDTVHTEPNSAGAASEKSRAGAMPVLPDASIYPFGPVGPRTALAPTPEVAKAAGKTADRRTMFESLVSSDTDLVGMVAYALYKHNKRDFLAAFHEMHGRAPDDGEVRAYLMGESTGRRVSMYRHLAENFLASQQKAVFGPEAAAPDAAVSPPTQRPRTLAALLHQRTAPRKRGAGWLTAAYIAFLVLLLVAIAVFIRTGFAPGR